MLQQSSNIESILWTPYAHTLQYEYHRIKGNTPMKVHEIIEKLSKTLLEGEDANVSDLDLSNEIISLLAHYTTIEKRNALTIFLHRSLTVFMIGRIEKTHPKTYIEVVRPFIFGWLMKWELPHAEVIHAMGNLTEDGTHALFGRTP